MYVGGTFFNNGFKFSIYKTFLLKAGFFLCLLTNVPTDVGDTFQTFSTSPCYFWIFWQYGHLCREKFQWYSEDRILSMRTHKYSLSQRVLQQHSLFHLWMFKAALVDLKELLQQYPSKNVEVLACLSLSHFSRLYNLQK